MPKKGRKKASILVLPSEEISLQPELSSPPRFRIQGGYHEGHKRTKKGNPCVKFLLLDITVLNISAH